MTIKRIYTIEWFADGGFGHLMRIEGPRDFNELLLYTRSFGMKDSDWAVVSVDEELN